MARWLVGLLGALLVALATARGAGAAGDGWSATVPPDAAAAEWTAYTAYDGALD